MRNNILPVMARRPEDRRLIKELNEEGQMSQKLSGAIQGAAMAGLGILAAVALAAAAPMDTRAETREPVGQFKLTWYCPCRRCSGKWGHQTSSGATCEEGVTVAASYFKPGTRIYIEGIGERIVQDTGVTGRHIDIFMENHGECLDNGVKYRQVYIVKED